MIQVYRMNELRSKYPSFIYVAQWDGHWYAEVKNPFAPSWWRELTSPRWRGMRWHAVRWLLTLIDVRWLGPLVEAPGPDDDVAALNQRMLAEVPGWAEVLAEVDATGRWSAADWPGPVGDGEVAPC